MRITIGIVFIASIFLKFFNAQAQESQIKFGAYMDSYYSYDFSKPLNNERLYVTQMGQHNEFNLNHAWIGGEYESDRVRASLALQIGTYVTTNYAAETTLSQMIYNAYAGYKVTKKSWLDVGVFGGHFGYESALSLERDLYSPALSTEYTPYYQSGLRYTYEFSENTQLRAVVLNGWQNIGETNNKKSVGIAIDHRFSNLLKVSYGNYYGNESTIPSADIMRFHNNLILETNPAEKLKLVGVLDYTTQEQADGESINALFLTFIGRYYLNDKFSIAGRYEYVEDKDALLIGNLSGEFDMNIISLSLNYYPTEDVAIKVESKLYNSSTDNFAGEDGVGNGSIVLNGGIAIRLD